MPNVVRLGGIVAAVLLLAACGAKEDKKAATQSAVRVNGAEITVHQVNQVLARLSGLPEEAAARARQEVLEKLIDQQLAVEQALEKKLDRQPDVMAALEAARREVLARAYLDQLVGAQGKPTAEEARKYYADHPELFAQRRIYNLQELVVEKNDALLPALRDKAATAKSLDEIAAWLKEKGVRFAGQSGVRPAEQIPLEMLGTLHAARDGQTVVTVGGPGIAVMRLLSSQTAPVDADTATPRILQYLANQRAKERVENEIKQLRQKAKIEYLGDFGKPAPAAAPAGESNPANETAKPVGNVGKAIGGLK